MVSFSQKEESLSFFYKNSIGLITAFRFLFCTRKVYFNLCWQQTGERMKGNKLLLPEHLLNGEDRSSRKIEYNIADRGPEKE